MGLTDYHSIELDWDDDSSIDLEEQEPLLGEIGETSGSHVYNEPGIYRPTVTITDNHDLASSKSLTISVAQKGAIDWKSTSTNPEINLTGEGNLKVAILGTEIFDPATVDPTTIRADDEPAILLDGQDVSAIGDNFHLQDLNNDGFQDLEITFNKSSLRDAIEMDAEPFLSSNQIYLFGSSSDFNGGFFLGMEE